MESKTELPEMNAAEKRMRLYSAEDSLPSLPLPSLEETAKRWLLSLQPVLLGVAGSDEGQSEYSRAEQAVADFLKDERAQFLHKKLLERQKERRNWLEHWWLRDGYLKWSAPIAINVNFFTAFDNPVCPPGNCPVKVAAALITGILNFRALLARDELEPQFAGRGESRRPMDMSQFRRVFTTVRQPDVTGGDRLLTCSPSDEVIVICRHRFYAVRCFDAQGRALDRAGWEEQFRIVRADAYSDHGSLPFSLGALTGGDRHQWALTRERLESRSAVTRRSLDAIDRAVWVLVFDDKSPDLQEDAATLALAGDPSNRYFDKICQTIVWENGRAGCNGEHTPVDAPTTAQVLDFSLQEFMKIPREELVAEAVESNASAAASPSSNSVVAPRKLLFELDEQAHSECEEAHRSFEKRASDCDVAFLYFHDFGAALIKKHFRISPDTFVQMVLQLAFWREQGEALTATYETAGTRLFYHGRTETVRSCSMATREMCLVWNKPDSSLAERAAAIRSAAAVHDNYMRASSMGRGCDRHLFGLGCMARDLGLEPPALLSTPWIRESTRFRLSTSNMIFKRFLGGFAAAEPDGYGVCYSTALPEELRFCIESKRSCPGTSSKRLEQAIVSTLRNFRDCLLTSKNKL